MSVVSKSTWRDTWGEPRERVKRHGGRDRVSQGKHRSMCWTWNGQRRGNRWGKKESGKGGRGGRGEIWVRLVGRYGVGTHITAQHIAGLRNSKTRPNSWARPASGAAGAQHSGSKSC